MAGCDPRGRAPQPAVASSRGSGGRARVRGEAAGRRRRIVAAGDARRHRSTLAVHEPVAAGGVARRRAARRAVPDLAAAARLASGEVAGNIARISGRRTGGLRPLPVGDGQPVARPGLDRRPARAVSPPVAALVALPPLTYAVLAVAYLVADGKAYYLATLYPALLGSGRSRPPTGHGGSGSTGSR